MANAESPTPAVTPAVPLRFKLTGSQQRDLALDVELSVEPGQRLALIGPNGAGKTTILRLLAGLETAKAGSQVATGETILADDFQHLPARRRHLPVSFAEPRLFPNLTVLQNLTFAICGGRRPTIADIVTAREALAVTGHSDLADRRAGQLSSGQSAIVAVLRASLAKPVGLLLDEPFSALDSQIAATARSAVHHRLESVAVPLVIATHSPLDVMALATHVAVIENGSVGQYGTVLSVANNPRSAFTASFLGLNLLSGIADGTQVTIAESNAPLTIATATPATGRVWLAFAPHALTVSTQPPTGSARNSWRTTLASMEQLGSLVRLEAEDPVAIRIDVTPAAIIALGLRPGEPIWVSLKATGIEVYSA